MPTIDDYRRSLDEMQPQLAQAAGQSVTMADRLNDAISQSYNYNKDLIDESSKAREAYYSATPTFRDENRDLYRADPLRAKALQSQAVAPLGARVNALEGYRQAREGSVSDKAGKFANVYQGEVERLRNEYGMTQDAYQRAFAEQQAEEARKQQEFQNQLAVQQLRASSRRTGPKADKTNWKYKEATYDDEGNLITPALRFNPATGEREFFDEGGDGSSGSSGSSGSTVDSMVGEMFQAKQVGIPRSEIEAQIDGDQSLSIVDKQQLHNQLGEWYSEGVGQKFIESVGDQWKFGANNLAKWFAPGTGTIDSSIGNAFSDYWNNNTPWGDYKEGE